MDKKIKSLLTESFKKFSEIDAVYLFGSQATNRQNPLSDLDLAVVAQTSDPARLKMNILMELSRNRVENADILIFEKADIVLRYEALKQNILIFKKKGFDRGSLYSKTVREYLDFLPYALVQREAYKKRIENGSH